MPYYQNWKGELYATTMVSRQQLNGYLLNKEKGMGEAVAGAMSMSTGSCLIEPSSECDEVLNATRCSNIGN